MQNWEKEYFMGKRKDKGRGKNRQQTLQKKMCGNRRNKDGINRGAKRGVK